MKICFIITGMGMGGAETQVAGLADGFAARGHEVLILGLTGSALVAPRNSAVRLEMMGLQKSPASMIRIVGKLCSRLREFRPDVVHSHMVHANLLARLIRPLVPMPRLFCTAHSNNEGGRLRMLAYRLTDWLCDGSSNVSRGAVDAFVKLHAVSRDRMIPVYNGIDTARFTFNRVSREGLRENLKIPQDVSVILAVGRLSEAKDYPTLLNAFAEVRIARPCVRLLIAGDGPLREELFRLSEHLGLGDSVQFLGIRRDIPDLMCAADVFVLSSAWEGFGLVVAEAMACRCPVVTTDCGGTAEIVGDTNVLVPPRDVHALTKGLIHRLNSTASENSNDLDRATARVGAIFSLDAKVDQWLRIYRDGIEAEVSVGLHA